MSQLTNRMIYSNNGVLSDLSITLNSIASGSSTLPVVALEDAFYVASDLPFNHLFIRVSTANILDSTMTVSLWDGSAFTAAVDLIDETAVGAKTLGQSGVVSFKLNKDSSWVKRDTDDGITGLTTLKIYDLYWAKITFSADLTLTTALSYIGHRFASEDDLKVFYPDLVLSTTKDKFESGKTDWNDQLIWASESVIRALKAEPNLDLKIASASQILDYGVWTEATLHRCAEIIFNAFGDSYKDDRDKANLNYQNAMKVGQSRMDLNRNARLDPSLEDPRAAGVFRR